MSEETIDIKEETKVSKDDIEIKQKYDYYMNELKNFLDELQETKMTTDDWKRISDITRQKLEAAQQFLDTLNSEHTYMMKNDYKMIEPNMKEYIKSTKAASEVITVLRNISGLRLAGRDVSYLMNDIKNAYISKLISVLENARTHTIGVEMLNIMKGYNEAYFGALGDSQKKLNEELVRALKVMNETIEKRLQATPVQSEPIIVRSDSQGFTGDLSKIRKLVESGITDKEEIASIIGSSNVPNVSRLIKKVTEEMVQETRKKKSEETEDNG